MEHVRGVFAMIGSLEYVHLQSVHSSQTITYREIHSSFTDVPLEMNLLFLSLVKSPCGLNSGLPLSPFQLT